MSAFIIERLSQASDYVGQFWDRPDAYWILIGFAGQALFMMRFIVQWIASEKAKKSVIPDLFWYFSIGGGLVLLSYAIYRGDPVFIFGQALGFFIYMRNLYFVLRDRGQKKQAEG